MTDVQNVSCHSTEPGNDNWFSNYLKDQDERKQNERQQKTNMTIEKLFSTKEKDRVKQPNERRQQKAKLTNELQSTLKEKDRLRKKNERQKVASTHTTEELSALKCENRIRKINERRQLASTLTTEELSALKCENRIRKRNERRQLASTLTTEELSSLKCENRIRKINERRQLASTLTSQQLSGLKYKDTIRKKNETRQLASTLTSQQLSALKCKHTIRKKNERRQLASTLTTDELSALKCKDKIRKTNETRQLASTITSQQLSALKCKHTIRKKNERRQLASTLTTDELSALKFKDKIRKTNETRQLASTLTSQQLSALKCKDTIRKKNERRQLASTLATEELSALKCKDTIRKKNERRQLASTLATEELSALKCKDTIRKKNERRQLASTLTTEELSALKCKDTIRKKNETRQLASTLTSQQQTALKSKNTVTKRNHRKQLNINLTSEEITTQKQKQNKQKIDQRHPADIHVAINRFRKGIKDYAKFICTCCNRLMYRRSVLRITDTSFRDIPNTLRNKCIRGKKSALDFEWICTTCRSYLKKNQMPPQADANNLEVPNTPKELSDLTALEIRLLCQRYPFMKLLALPKGKQKALKGSVINVPVNHEEVCCSLPRTLGGAGILPLKLKRKLQYKTSDKFEYIRPEKIIQGLKWLKQNNIHYKSVNENSDWIQECADEDKETFDNIFENSMDNGTGEIIVDNITTNDKMSSASSSHVDNDSDIEHDGVNSKLRGVKYDTCMQSINPALDVDTIINIAPGENKIPMNILMDEHFEEMAFPHLLPNGKFGFKCERPVKLTAKKYFQKRLLDSRGTFAQDVEYLFVAQTITEKQQIMDCMSIALRKAYTSSENELLTAGIIRNSDTLKNFLFNDQAYMYLQPVRGTPPYWQKVQYKLLSAIKQFGIFTWFFTVSAADLKWIDTIQEIMSQRGQTIMDAEIDALTWERKCEILRSNPVSAARHFQFRMDLLMKEIILSKSEPLGHVLHYFYRIEFQQRGSPHAHGVLWISDAPHPENDTAESITTFIDKYVHCKLPSAETEPELHSLVTQLQRHAHSNSCRKTGKLCRFGYPRPISSSTVLSKPYSDDNVAPELLKQKTAEYKEILSVVRTYLDNTPDIEQLSYDDVLQNCNLNADTFQEALSNSSRSPTVYMKRDPESIMINNYNASLLLAWQANLDLQFVSNPFACIQYVVAYITKEEREIGTLLATVAKESSSDGVKEQMKKCGQTFLNSRSVTAQEAAYRALGLPLYKSNFESVWVATGLPHQRVSILKPNNILTNLEDDDSNIFVSGIGEKYSNRPLNLENMCLAHFATWYRTDSNYKDVPANDFQPDLLSQIEDDTSQPNDPCGNEPSKITIRLPSSNCTMRKRKRQAVLRYHRFSELRDTESFYHSQLYLFLPWRQEEPDLLSGHDTYMDSYLYQKETLDKNQSNMQKYEALIEAAVEQLQQEDRPTNAWDELAPETQQQEQEADDEGIEVDSEHAFLHPHEDQPSHRATLPTPAGKSELALGIESMPSVLPFADYSKHIQSLNAEQYSVLQVVLKWCTSYMQSQGNKKLTVPEPLHLFISGGAGTGKSHLIKALYHTIHLTLRKEGECPDIIKALLLAPTGTAAFNIEGITIHSAFLFTLSQSRTYKNMTKSKKDLSDEKRNTLRSKLSHLKFIIIDEISMVGSDFFVQIHNRLNELFGGSDIFGGVSVIVLGDMYQLPPVGQRLIFQQPSDSYAALAPSLWGTYFTYMQLTQVMRQAGDTAFCNVLNRIRVGKQTSEDIELLKTRIIEDSEETDDILHVYAFNKKVDRYNEELLKTLPPPIFTLKAVDKIPASLRNITLSSDTKYTGGLPETIELAVGARVILTRNIDVCDGLANGSQGTVVDIKLSQNSIPLAVMVRFDNKNVGHNMRMNSKINLSHYEQDVVPIFQIEASFSPSVAKVSVTRKQFALKLCWASTVHKVQGSTLNQIVVSFQDNFNKGQAYVALSRVKTLDGLFITEFDERKIKTNVQVSREMERMAAEAPEPNPFSCLSQKNMFFTVAFLNARSARLHFQDIFRHPILNTADVLCLAETNIYENQAIQYQREGWTMTCLPQLPRDNCHGLIVYTRDTIPVIATSVSFKPYMEQLRLTISTESCLKSVCLLYRSPSTHPNCFIDDVSKYVLAETPDLVLGDLNMDVSTASYKKFLCALPGYNQLVGHPTHISGSTIDQVYTRREIPSPDLYIFPTYFSDHSIVYLQYKHQQI